MSRPTRHIADGSQMVKGHVRHIGCIYVFVNEEELFQGDKIFYLKKYTNSC